MANRRRGEIAATIAGRPYTLCLTLGALAELEDAFGAADLGAVAERFAGGRLASRDLVAVLGAGLRGGGHPLSDAEVAALPLEDGLAEMVAAVAALLAHTFGEPTPDARPGSLANPPQPQAM